MSRPQGHARRREAERAQIKCAFEPQHEQVHEPLSPERAAYIVQINNA